MKEKKNENQLSIEQIITQKHRGKNVELDINDAYLTHHLQSKNDSFFRDKANEYAHTLIKESGEDLDATDLKKIKPQEYFLPIQAPFQSITKPKFKFIDLFAGVGGFRMALQNVGGKALFSSEFENNAKFTYAKNYGEVPFGDITKDEIKAAIPAEFDILCGGFPCQAFSIAGHRKGFSDTRGTLFFDIEKIVETHMPKVVFLENVKNLLTHDKGNTYRVIKEILEKKLNYVVYEKVLNSMTHANVPQNRERIFIVAFDPTRVPNHADFTFPEPIKLTRTIHDILEPGKQEDKYYYKENHMYYPELDRTMRSVDTLYQWRRVYVRENKNNVCPTLTANMGAGGHNVPLVRDEFGIRKLTPRECFSFQGYPKDFVISPVLADSKLYMQAGNSVTMPLVQRIAEKIVEVL
ncbi:MAG: DNA cytosine methyltransferase [Sphingobacterium sp.]|jgi:DNA (cytosine-5)-methyltransferase 1|nr:DNA cytosine methyltransferase [Sphingobacterium sp.]